MNLNLDCIFYILDFTSDFFVYQKGCLINKDCNEYAKRRKLTIQLNINQSGSTREFTYHITGFALKKNQVVKILLKLLMEKKLNYQKVKDYEIDEYELMDMINDYLKKSHPNLQLKKIPCCHYREYRKSIKYTFILGKIIKKNKGWQFPYLLDLFNFNDITKNNLWEKLTNEITLSEHNNEILKQIVNKERRLKFDKVEFNTEYLKQVIYEKSITSLEFITNRNLDKKKLYYNFFGKVELSTLKELYKCKKNLNIKSKRINILFPDDCYSCT